MARFQQLPTPGMKNRLRRVFGNGKDDNIYPAQWPDPGHLYKLIYSQC